MGASDHGDGLACGRLEVEFLYAITFSASRWKYGLGGLPVATA